MEVTMKILFPKWKNFGVEDITETFEKMGHQVVLYEKEPKNYRIDPKFKSELKKFIKDNNIDLIFSSNYFPVISDACHDIKIPYISWCYDSPLVLTYSKTVFNPENYIFIFDSKMVEDLKNLGVKNVYYMPMAVNAERLSNIKATEEQKKIVEADVSFVGSLYTEKHTLYDRMTDLDDHTRGYIEGIMQAQKLLYGVSILEESLSPEITEKLYEAMPIKINDGDMETFPYLYANYFLSRKITQTERTELLKMISEILPEIMVDRKRKAMPLKLYTPEPTPFLPKVKNMGTVHYLYEMPLVFRHSKINLNITLRSIQNGIPLRAMDIMGAGGFLLTNYQNDSNRHFIDGEDYVSFSSPEDMIQKIAYYLEHEKERNEIAENGCRKVHSEHTYQKRIYEMLKIAGIE